VSIEALSERTLDAAIARHLLGLEVEQRRNAYSGQLDYVARREGEDWTPVQCFSEAGNYWSLAVEFKLSDFGWHLTPASKARRQATGSVRVVLERGGTLVAGTATTFEAALCVAALRAVGRGDAVLKQEVEAWRAGQRDAAKRYRALYGKYFSRHN
jgi:hypothetical protein